MATTADNVYEFYRPSKILALVACVVFAVFSFVHLGYVSRYRKHFCFVLVIGGLFEVAGLGARIYSTDHLRDQGAYGTQTLLILLAPIFFSAAIYMFLGRIIRATEHTDLSIIRTAWLSKFFVIADVLCFVVQACGAGMLVNANNTADQNSGENVILAGLALQVVILVIFLICAGVFHARLAKRGLIGGINPRLYLVAMLGELYTCAMLILFRNVFRLVEFGLGDDGYLQAHEWPIFVLDILLMAMVMALALSWYPADLQIHHDPYRQRPMTSAA
ncbi:Rtm1p [Fusarium agapanthi]|uniref:Rtm1p n=1 Tax=Fusarium agapanthi TaxID=1803897 RepID=A0A9P5EFS8_9HYPO|nr:Rtm1p [Fusarium agapanthi]